MSKIFPKIYLKFDLKYFLKYFHSIFFKVLFVTKQMNSNKYYSTISYNHCNTYSYSYVITVIVYHALRTLASRDAKENIFYIFKHHFIYFTNLFHNPPYILDFYFYIQPNKLI